MAGTASALDILAAPDDWHLGEPTLVVLHGDEPFLVLHMLEIFRARLCPDEADRAWAWREFDGAEELDPRDVFDEAATIPMFATATRAAVVRGADAFVTAARDRLETIATADRGRRGLVILEVKTFPSNTRLAKAVAKQGVAIDTSLPAKADLSGWIRKWATSRHGITLAAATAQRLIERLGGNLGQIDQALARLAAATDPQDKKKAIPPEAIDDFAGSPQERTAWGMVDAAAGGDTRRALAELADLLDAGENPIGIAAQIASVLRRLSTAERLLDAGGAAWPKAMAQAKDSLQQLGPRRARRLPVWLLDLDLALKGEASRGLRSRLALERLFCKMARGGESAGRGSPPASRPSGARP